MTRKYYFSVYFVIGIVLGSIYFNWRLFTTINYQDGALIAIWSVLLFLAELHTFFVFTSFSMALSRKNEPESYYHNIVSHDNNNKYPSVDIFICILNESLDILKDTVIGCLNIDYPNKKIYILDDGRRDDVRQLAENFCCNYITRDTNKGFKAGNINNALKQTDGELVLIFDVDHIPVSNFLKETVLFFEDPVTAIVQTPQHFFNPDSFQKNLSLQKTLLNEQSFFYGLLQPCLSKFQSAMCCGTNFLFRRKYVEEVGGFPEKTITEDTALGLRLGSKGYRIRYYSKPMAAGRAPETFKDFIKQRSRWARGNLQIFLNKENWQYLRSLKPTQFYFELNSMLYYLFPFARLMFIASPVLFLFLGIKAVNTLMYQLIIFQIGYFTYKYIFALIVCKKYRNFFLAADLYEISMSPFLAFDILKMLLIPSKLSKQTFTVTRKGGDIDLKEGRNYFIILLSIALILFMANIKGLYDIYSANSHTAGIIINLFWNTFNLVAAIFAVNVSIEKRERRKEIRVPTDINAYLTDNNNLKIRIKIKNLSKAGALIQLLEGILDLQYINELKELKLYISYCEDFNYEFKIIQEYIDDNKIHLRIAFCKELEASDETFIKEKRIIEFMYKDSCCWC